MSTYFKSSLLRLVPMLVLFTGACRPPADEANNPDGLPVPAGCQAKRVPGGAVTSDEQLAAFEGSTSIDGSLTLSGEISNVNALGCLTQITGNLQVRSSSLRKLDLPELLEVGTIVITDSSVREIDLGKLQTVGSLNGESLRFEHLDSLESLKLGALEESTGIVLQISGAEAAAPLALDLGSLKKAGSIWMRQLDNLETLAGLRALEEVGGELRVETSGRLQDMPLGALRSVGTLLVASSGKLATVDLSKLQTVGSLNGESLRFEHLDSLESLKLGALEESTGIVLQISGAAEGPPLQLDFASLANVGGALYIKELRNLETMTGFASLTRVDGALVIQSNGRLPQCAAEALLGQLAAAPPQTTLAGNAANASCTP